MIRIALAVALDLVATLSAAQAPCADIVQVVVVGPSQLAADLPDRATTAAYEVAVFPEGTPATGTPVKRVTINAAAWAPVGGGCYTTPMPANLASAMQGHYQGAIRPAVSGPPTWSELSNIFAYVADPALPPPVTVVAFVKTDATTQGTWKGVYGATGAVLVADSVTLPPGATMSTMAPPWTYLASTTDVRALQKALAADRRAAVWYGPATMSFDVTPADALAYKLSLYVLDWDSGGGRREVLDLLDPTTGSVLDTRVATAFGAGVYYTWQVTGPVRVRVTNNVGVNGVLSGIFLDPAVVVPPPPTTKHFRITDVSGSYEGDLPKVP